MIKLHERTNGGPPPEEPKAMSEYDVDDPRLVQAAEESGLAGEYRTDPSLLRFYMKRLLIRGWAGSMSATEARYVSLARKAVGKGPSEKQIEHFRSLSQKRIAVEPANPVQAEAGTGITPKPDASSAAGGLFSVDPPATSETRPATVVKSRASGGKEGAGK